METTKKNSTNTNLLLNFLCSILNNLFLAAFSQRFLPKFCSYILTILQSDYTRIGLICIFTFVVWHWKKCQFDCAALPIDIINAVANDQNILNYFHSNQIAMNKLDIVIRFQVVLMICTAQIFKLKWCHILFPNQNQSLLIAFLVDCNLHWCRNNDIISCDRDALFQSGEWVSIKQKFSSFCIPNGNRTRHANSKYPISFDCILIFIPAKHSWNQRKKRWNKFANIWKKCRNTKKFCRIHKLNDSATPTKFMLYKHAILLFEQHCKQRFEHSK